MLNNEHIIPQGWGISSLSDLIAIKHGFAFKSEFFSESGQYILLTPGNFHEEGVKEEKRLNVIPIKQKNDMTKMESHTASLSATKERNDLLQQFVKELMVAGQDYGMINGNQKPTLLKPGAEKLCQFLQLSVEYSVVKRLEDWGNGLFHYEVNAHLSYNTNEAGAAVVGIGSCNSKEYQFQKQHPFSIVNTVLKMAKKRALIDGVLNITATSSIFTQDIEDFPRHTTFKGGDEAITKDQLKQIYQLVKEVKIKPEVVTELIKLMFNVDHSTKLSKGQASQLIHELLIFQKPY